MHGGDYAYKVAGPHSSAVTRSIWRHSQSTLPQWLLLRPSPVLPGPQRRNEAAQQDQRVKQQPGQHPHRQAAADADGFCARGGVHVAGRRVKDDACDAAAEVAEALLLQQCVDLLQGKGTSYKMRQMCATRCPTAARAGRVRVHTGWMLA